MNYLEQVLAATKAHNLNAKRSQLNVQNVLGLVDQRNGIQEAAARRVPQAAPSAPSGGSGPHHKGDGHNHSGSGGSQTVGEANELWRRLQLMLKDRPTIKPGARSRSYAEQVRLWNLYKAGKGAQAARPGTSKHGTGRANDLKYSNEADRQWALANAHKYGLSFPLYNPKLGRGRDESWHIELKR